MAVTAAPGGAQRTGNPLLDTLPVFVVELFNCQQGGDRRQTGVVVEGIDGLTTALHGALGCQSLAHNDVTGRVWRDLRLQLADVERDIAVLRSPGLIEDLKSGRVKPQRRGTASVSQPDLVVVGITTSARNPLPFGTRLAATHATIRGTVQPGTGFHALEIRGSPSVDASLLTVTGPLQPGHSGAPIVDSAGRVVGIGDGGSKLHEQFGWGIPMDSIKAIDVAALSNQLSRLANENSQMLFSAEPGFITADPFSTTMRILASGAARDGGIELRVGRAIEASSIRWQPEFTAGFDGHGIRQSVETLPGLDRTSVSRTAAGIPLGLAVSVYFGQLPRGGIDPYVRLAVAGAFADADSVPYYPVRTEIDIGGDMRFRHGPAFFLELGYRTAELVDFPIKFDRYGNAETPRSTSISGYARLSLGFRFDLSDASASLDVRR